VCICELRPLLTTLAAAAVAATGGGKNGIMA